MCVSHMIRELEYYLELDRITGKDKINNEIEESMESNCEEVPSASATIKIDEIEPTSFKCTKCIFETKKNNTWCRSALLCVDSL